MQWKIVNSAAYELFKHQDRTMRGIGQQLSADCYWWENCIMIMPSMSDLEAAEILSDVLPDSGV